MTMTDILLSILAAIPLTGGSVWLLKKSLESILKLDVDKRVNEHKAELDRVRDTFQIQIQSALLTMQLQTHKTHEIYPELYEKLMMAQGRVASHIGLNYANTWEEYSIEDLKTMMTNRSVVSGKIEYLCKAIQLDRPSGLKEMNNYLNMLRYNETMGIVGDVQNYTLLKSLYITEEISKDALDIGEKLWHATVDLDPDNKDIKSCRENLKETDALLTSIKAKMKKELSQKEI